MADRSGRTEKATGKRRREARGKGQVARSQDVNSAAGLLAAFAVLALSAPRLLSGMEGMLTQHLSTVGDTRGVTTHGLEPMIRSALTSFATEVGPVLGAAAAAGLLANLAQVRFNWSFAALRPRFGVLNPANGLKRLFGLNGLVETGKALVKLGAIGGVAFLGVWSDLPQLGSLVGAPPNEVLSQIGHRVEGIALKILVVLVVLAAIDVVWQRRKLAKALMMSKEEVKQEARQTDIAPELRGAIRRKQFQLSRRRMLAEIPSADVVVVNPTHYAVALRYNPALPAPEVVAKGVDHIAAAIRAAAEEHGVPLVENPPLARTLYRDVELGSMIPEALFVAVAEVLAYVYRTARGRARARRRAAARAALVR